MTNRTRWFKAAVTLGFLLGILLLGHTIYTFRDVVRPLVLGRVTDVAAQLVSDLENAARAANVADTAALAVAAETFRRARPDLVAAIRIEDQDGRVLATTTGEPLEPLAAPVRQAVLESRAPHVIEVRTGPRGEVLVVALPFRFQFPAERAGRVPPGEPSGQPRFKVAEIALPVEANATMFWTLRRALAITLAAAVALLVTMTVFALQFRRYLRAKQIEQQLAVARLVQQQLLPRDCRDCGHVTFAIEFLPAFELGGDYGDIFRAPNGDVVLVLGDVAGKGLPAALLMGVVHGAVRAASVRWNHDNLVELAGELNELLCERTADNRYATLFWGFLDTGRQTLRYVNAGHLPPLVARPGPTGDAGAAWLSAGGPVIGLLPGAPYAAGETRFGPGDRLILFSDGLTEATSADGEEFGRERLLAAVLPRVAEPPAGLARAILEAVRTFTGDAPFADDLTLLVVARDPAAPE